MAGWLLTGYIGAGKSCHGVRWLIKYMACGGRGFTNIPIYGWCDHINDFCPMEVASPFIGLLRKKYHWQYQPHQLTYMSYDAMRDNPDWFHAIPAGADREHRTLAVIDECSDLFDVNDRDSVRAKAGESLRACLRFIRLSRHAHVELVFIMQNEGLTMSSLNKLCENKLKIISFDYFFERFHLPFSLGRNIVIHTRNQGKLQGSNFFVPSKDPAIWACYRSEALADSIGVKQDAFFVDPSKGALKGYNLSKIRKEGDSPMWFKCASILALFLSCVSLRFLIPLRVDVSKLQLGGGKVKQSSSSVETSTLPSARLAGVISRPGASPLVPPVSASGPSVGSALASVAVSAPSCVVGTYSYGCAGEDAWAFFKGVKLVPLCPSPWGLVREIYPSYAVCWQSDPQQKTYLVMGDDVGPSPSVSASVSPSPLASSVPKF